MKSPEELALDLINEVPSLNSQHRYVLKELIANLIRRERAHRENSLSSLEPLGPFRYLDPHSGWCS